MPKDIAVVSYNLDPTSSLTQDAVVIRDQLNGAGYKAELVHQWSFDETNSATFKSQDQWEKYDGVVVCNFYQSWNLRELIRSARPILCVNVGYADDCGLAEGLRDHAAEEQFKVIDNSHPITTGFPLGVIDIGAPVFFDSVSTLNHQVDVLVTTLASNPPLAYFAWYRTSQAPAGSLLFKLLVQAANWTFSGP